jgi:hypothetical protein
MKYIKLFEEKTITRTAELKQFCNDNLAYLIDNNFDFSVKVSREAQIHSDSSFKRSIKYPPSQRYDTIVIEKFRPNNDWKMVFDFDEFSDDLVPFILFLNEKYSIKSIFFLEPYNNSVIRWDSISKEKISDEDIDLSSLDNKKIEKLVITINK